MKKIKIITHIVYLSCSSNNLGLATFIEQDCVYDNLYNLIEDIDYNESDLIYNENLDFLTENFDNQFYLHSNQFNSSTPHSTDNDFFPDQKQYYGMEYKINRKRGLENAPVDEKDDNNCYHLVAKRQKTSQYSVHPKSSAHNPKTHSEEERRQANLAYDNNNSSTSCSDTISIFSTDTCNTSNEAFSNALINLLKNILFYRHNIAKFLYQIHCKSNYNNDAYLKTGTNNPYIEDFIMLSAVFAESNKNNVHPELTFISDSEVEKHKIYDKRIVNYRSQKIPFIEIRDSLEYRSITKYNKKYASKLAKILFCSEFSFLQCFLTNVFYRIELINKYYDMLSNLLQSLYEISLFINNNMINGKNNQTIDLAFFKVLDCCCSEVTKENFIFHWVICWSLHFSTHYILPKIANKQKKTLDILNTYPREFFIQSLLLLYYNIDFKNSYINRKKLNPNTMIMFKDKISKLLFDKLEASDITLYQLTIYDLWKATKEPFDPEILMYSVLKIRMKQTHKDYITSTNQLVPALQEFVKTISEIVKESYRLTTLTLNQYTY